MGKIGFSVNEIEETKENSLAIPCDYQHAICVGATGSGKTASVILPTMKDRIESNHALLAYIYKGHEDKKIKQIAKEAGRLGNVIEIGKPHGSYINLLSMLDREGVKNVFLALLGANSHSAGRDPYWSIAASRVGTSIVEILRQMHKIYQLLSKNSEAQINFNIVTVTIGKDDEAENISYPYPTGVPTFKTVFQITSYPKYVKCFFDGLNPYIEQVHKAISREIKQRDMMIQMGKKPSMNDKQIKHFAKQASIEILKLEKIINDYGKFHVSVESGENGGNNGVLQILNNGLMGVSNRDYINFDGLDIMDALEHKAIVIIDIEGLGKDIHGVLLESILSKLSARVRNGTPASVSIFIDEANRVLSTGMDIHNDVLREANVELIVAIQNEEQMITKFGDVAWQAIRKNFKHNYEIGLDHSMHYNNEATMMVSPLLFDEDVLKSADYAYNRQEHVQKNLYDNFDIETLPDNFHIVYTINTFESQSTIDLVDKENMITSIEYLGVALKKSLHLKMRGYGFAAKNIQKSFLM